MESRREKQDRNGYSPRWPSRFGASNYETVKLQVRAILFLLLGLAFAVVPTAGDQGQISAAQASQVESNAGDPADLAVLADLTALGDRVLFGEESARQESTSSASAGSTTSTTSSTTPTTEASVDAAVVSDAPSTAPQAVASVIDTDPVATTTTAVTTTTTTTTVEAEVLGTTEAPDVPEPTSIEARGQAMFALMSFDWRTAFPNWVVEFHEGRSGIRGLTYPRERRIELFVRDEDTPETLYRVFAHEIGHVIDGELNDNDDRRRWVEQRGIAASAPWWPSAESPDFATGAGDFAETFAVLEAGITSRSTVAAQPTSADLSLMRELMLG